MSTDRREAGMGIEIPFTLMRGGTSKALFFRAEDLPESSSARDSLFLKALGSPDKYGKQLNGLGGATSSTNKIAIVSPSRDELADIDFEFVQVGIRSSDTSRTGTCGNISSAVGLYAVLEGLASSGPGAADVRVRNTNTGKHFSTRFLTDTEGLPLLSDAQMAGASGPGVEIDIEFVDPAGAITGKLLPTGNTLDLYSRNGLEVPFTLIDAANPVVFIAAHDVDIDLETVSAEDAGLRVAAEIRRYCAYLMGFSSSAAAADDESPALPLVALMATPTDYVTSGGETVAAKDYSLRSTMMSMGLLHGAHPFTGAIATALSSSLAGTVAHQLAIDTDDGRLQIGHPSGILDIQTKTEEGVDSVAGMRTARRLAKGVVYAD